MVLMLEMTASEARYRGMYKNFKYPKDLKTVLSVIAQDKRVLDLPTNKIYAILSKCEGWLGFFKEGKYKKYYFPTLKAIAETPSSHPYTGVIRTIIKDYLVSTPVTPDEEEIEEIPWDETNMDFVNQQLLDRYQFESKIKQQLLSILK